MSLLHVDHSVIRDEMSSWLSGFQWDQWGTYTFTEPFSAESARRAILRHHHRMVKDFGREHPFFWVVEPHSHYALSGAHAHALIGRINDIRFSVRRMSGDWRAHDGHGYCKFEKYLIDHGVDYYLTKYVIKQEYQPCDWGLEGMLPESLTPLEETFVQQGEGTDVHIGKGDECPEV